MLVAFSCSLVGVVEVAAPVALLPAVAAATLFAREQRDFLAAAAATALLALRGLPHANLYAGYGVGWQLWLLLFGLLLIGNVFVWPMPRLFRRRDRTIVGLVAGLLRMLFVSGACMMMGPLSKGWAALAGVLRLDAHGASKCI